MATITSVASGTWKTAGTWDLAREPVDGDKVVIAAGHTVTIEGTCAGGDDSTTATIGSAAINVSGTLYASRTVTNSLTCKGLLLVNNTGFLDYGTAAAPITGSAELVINKRVVSSNGNGLQTVTPTSNAHVCAVSFYGSSGRVRNAVLASNAASGQATAVLTTSAHGWQNGDRVLLVPTNASATVDEGEILTILSSSGATITFTTNLTYTHLANAPACNMSSNLVVRANDPVNGATIRIGASLSFTGDQGMTAVDVVFESLPIATNQNGFNFTNTLALDRKHTFSKCAFDTKKSGIGDWAWIAGNANLRLYADDCAFATTVTDGGNIYLSNSTARGGMTASSNTNFKTATIDNCWVSGRSGQNGIIGGGIYTNCTFQAVKVLYLCTPTTQPTVLNNCDVGSTYGFTTQFSDYIYRLVDQGGKEQTLTLNDCILATAATIPDQAQYAVKTLGLDVTYVNKARSVLNQEKYSRYGIVSRENTNVSRGVSSIKLNPYSQAIVLGSPLVKTQTIAVTAGAYVRIYGRIKAETAFYNTGGANWTPPTVSVSGVGITTAKVNGTIGTPTFTASSACNNAWETFDIIAQNTSGVDGNMTLTYSVTQKLIGGAGSVYFDGVTDSPFVTKVRHFGFAFDESSPSRTRDFATTVSAVDPVYPTIAELVSAEATAVAIGGVTISYGTSVALTANRTFQQLYDYTRAQACLNIASSVPITGTGVSPSVSLTAAVAVTTTGWTLNGSGSLAMGSNTLTASVPWVYTYTGGTFSQSSTVPSFNGGTLALGNGGTYTFTMAGSTLVNVTPAGSAVYTLSAGSFTGTLTVNNTTATPVTVYVPSGTTTSSAGNTGGAITFSAPIIQQSVTLSGVVAGSRVQIYDTTNSVELFNGTSGYSWTDSVAAVAPRAIRVRISYQSGTTAYNFIEANIGTCGTTSPSNAITYLASQTLDTVYNANGIDGSAVTGITITDSIDRMVMNIAGGSVSWPQIYAYNVYWLTQSAGIIDDGSIITAKDTANYSVSLFKIRNTATGVPLSITGGYGVDSTTGTVAPLIDTAGSTGNIYQTPDHVVAYQTSGTYAITGDISTVLTAVGNVPANVLSAAATDPIAADIKQVNNITVNGDGAGTPWGP